MSILMISMRVVLFLSLFASGLTTAGAALAAPKEGAVFDRIACGTVETTVRFGDLEEALGVPVALDNGAVGARVDGCAPDEALRTEIDSESTSGSTGPVDVRSLVSESASLTPEQVERLQALLGSLREVLGVDQLLDLFGSDEESEVLVDLQEASEEALDTNLEMDERSPEEMAELEAELIARALANIYRYPDAAGALSAPSPHYHVSAYLSNLNILNASVASDAGSNPAAVRNRSILEYLLGLVALIPNKISIALFVGTLILLRLLMLFINRHSHH